MVVPGMADDAPLTLLDLPGAYGVASSQLRFANTPPRPFADDLLCRVMRDCCARDLVALGATCRRFAAASPLLEASVPEAAAKARCLAVGWPARARVCSSWVVALRLTECAPALPSGQREGLHRSLHAAKLTPQGEPAAAPPPGAPCSACGMPGNSWLNLSTGAVLCGRRFHDGSGGNGCALMHAAAQARALTPAPLVVKLGTVTADLRAGELRADVFSYAVRSKCADARLAQHLAHWGIDAATEVRDPRVTAVSELGAEMDKRFEAAVAAWFNLPLDQVPEVLGSLLEAQRQHLKALFRRSSRAAFAAQRAAFNAQRAMGAGAGLPPLPDMTLPPELLPGQPVAAGWVAQNAAAEAAAEAEQEVWAEAEDAATDFSLEDGAEFWGEDP